MTKFDKIILELSGNLPSLNPDEIAKKIGPALKSVPTNVQQAIRGVSGAMEAGTEKSPEEAMLIDKLKDPQSKFTSDDIVRLQKLFLDRGIEFPKKEDQNQQNQKQQDQNQQNQNQSEEQEEESSTVYGGQTYGV